MPADGLDSAGLERLTWLVTRALAVPFSAVCLVEGERLRVVACQGLEPVELPRHGTLPGHTLDRGELTLIPDLAEAPGAPPGPLVAGRPLRFYVGVPLRDPDGEPAGTLCAGDLVPRRLDAEGISLLGAVAELAADQFRLRRELAERARALGALADGERRFKDFAEIASDWFWETDAELRYTWLSDGVREQMGIEPDWHYGKTRLELAARDADRAVVQAIHERMLRREPYRDVEYLRRGPGVEHWLRVSGKPVFDRAGTFLGYRGTGRDITEAKRREQRAREAEERYRRLVELSPDGIVVHREGRLVFANAKAVEILGGRCLDDVLGVSSLDLCEPAYREAVAERIRRLQQPGTELEPFEFRMRRLDGSVIDVETRAVTVMEDGRPAAQVVLRDVTERKRLEAERAEAEERYRALVELSPDPVILVEDGRFAFANRPAAELFGVGTPAELAGRSVYDFLPQERHAVVRERHATPRGEGEPLPPIELEIVRPDGTRVEVEAKGSLVLHHGRRMLLGVLRDIGARKAAERALEEAEQRWRRLVEMLPDAVLLLDGDTILLANRSAARLYGVETSAHLVGRSSLAFLSPELRPRSAARLRQLIAAGGELPPVEALVRRADGTEVHVDSRAVLVEEAGRRLVLAVLRDVTERKAAERALADAEERHRTLVEVAPVGILVYRDGRYRYANRAAAGILGAPDPSALVGVDPFELITEPFRAAIRARADRVLATGLTAPPVEIEMRRLDGRLVTVETVTAAIHDRGERALQIVMRDVSERKAAERALKEAEERWRSLVELSPEAVLLLRDGRYVFANRRAAELFGAAEPGELVGRSPAEFFLEAYRPLIAERGEKLLREGGRVPPIEVQLRRLDGRVIDVETSGTLVLDGGRPAIQTVLRDITERKAAERALKEAEERHRTLVEVAPVGILVYRDDCYRYANRAAASILGAAGPGELVGLDPFALILEPYHEAIRARSIRLLEGGPCEPPLEIEMRRLDGAVVSVATRGVPIREAGRPAIQILIEDVSERKRLESELRRLAYHDALTGLPNRTLFFDRLGQALHRSEREGRSGAFLLLDLDGFKQVNDAFGHDAGDALLRGVARRLLRVTRRSDTVARLAGDEFALLLYPIRDAATVERVADRIRAALTAPVRHRGRSLQARSSIGAAVFPDAGTTVDTLAKHADLALYRAKAEGRGGLALVDRAMWLAFTERIRLGEELREAIAGDAIELAYEPRCALDDGRPVAVEAVPLWSHPQLGAIEAATLVELAGECGLVARLAPRLLARALDECRARDGAGLPALPLAIDLPAGHLVGEGSAAQILEQLRARDLPPARLAIEVAENAFQDRHAPTLVETLARLRAAGVTILLDRFGAGSCSMRPLIDRLVDGVNFLAGPASAEDGTTAAPALAASLAGVAAPLGLQVTALGVASEEQRRSLAALGCGRGQGPLWSKPLSADALVTWLRRSAADPTCPCALSGGPILPRPEPTAPPRAP